MPSRRDLIKMSDEEAAAFIAEQKTVVCATNGQDGWPHLMPLWFVVREGTLWAWTFGKSQKVRNLERDPRATLQLEAGTEYHELRGVMLSTEVKLHADLDTVLGVGVAVLQRYGGGAELDEGVRAGVAKQAEKRVAFEFTEVKRTSWDHRKLGSTY